MNTNDIVMMVTGAIVMVLIAGAVLVPIIGASIGEYSVIDNRPYALYEMAELNEDSTYEMQWSTNTPTEIVINGENVQLREGSLLCVVNDYMFRFGHSSNGYYLQPIATTFDGSINSSLEPDVDVDILISNGTLSYKVTGGAHDGSVKTEPMRDGFVLAPDGKGTHVLKQDLSSAYVTSSTRIVSMGVRTIDGVWNVGFSSDGNISDLSIKQFSGSTMYNIGDETINYAPVDGRSDLYEITNFEFDVTNPTTSDITHVSFGSLIIPATITVPNSNHIGGVLGTILSILPIFVIISIVLWVAVRFKEWRY